MRKFIVSIAYGMIAPGSVVFAIELTNKRNGGFDSFADPEVRLLFILILWIFGAIIVAKQYSRIMAKKEEEEARQAEQDQLNELMRDYLEKKLQEEAKKESSEHQKK